MITMRRYRIFLLVALLTVVSTYYLIGGHRSSIQESFDIIRNVHDGPSNGNRPFPQPPRIENPENIDKPAEFKDVTEPAPPTATEEKVVVPELDVALPKKPNLHTIEDNGTEKPQKETETRVFEQEGQKYEEIRKQPAHISKQHSHERFPIMDKDLIRLPSGDPMRLPRIQYAFEKESTAQTAERLKKLNIIRKSFEHAWGGYKQYAMGADELKPLSKAGANQTQFMGWGATLVDSLDTLWIMGLTEEFENAVQQVEKISFKSSTSDKIPLFETVIRYLGGLISAYDLSGGKHIVLLNKAVELAEVLMGAFDTPNRMPIPYYYWNRTGDSELRLSHRNTVLAELGSLSMEFTRLAQLKKEDKYYDAVARITNALEAWQHETKMPGLWPLRLDSSGCKDMTKIPTPVKETIKAEPKKEIKDPYDHDDEYLLSGKAPPEQPKKVIKDPYDHDDEFLLNGEEPAIKPPKKKQDVKTGALSKRQTLEQPGRQAQAKQEKLPGCDPQGLRHEPNSRLSFGIGALADSVYEYMPKMHALLGGRNKQYRTMYDYAMKTVRDHLLFRPMIKDEKRNLLFVARREYNLLEKDLEQQKTMIWEGTHLTCFAGGMFALAAKLFENQKDMEIAKKLTDGCVWAYESTATGIMPESFNLVPCDSQNSCPWNEEKWHQLLDFGQQKTQQDKLDVWSALHKNQQDSQSGKQPTNAMDVSDSKAKVKGEEKPVFKAGPRKPVATVHKGGIVKEFDSHLEKRATDPDPGEGVAGSAKLLPQARANKDEERATQLEKPSFGSNKEIYESGSGKQLDKASKKSLKTGTKGLDDANLDNESNLEDDDDKTESHGASKNPRKHQEPTQTSLSEDADEDNTPLPFEPKAALSHKDYVAMKIQEERLPTGYTSIFDRSYKLRPEAIESVFIMWRLTGDVYWREKGWTMFESIQRATITDIGNAAVMDVTSALGANSDSMESFWLAETLKYFYLLFSEPDVISLDDYVLNTEAHPFKLSKESR